MKYLCLILALTLAGCATAPGKPTVVEVKIPVPVLCQAVEPIEPVWNTDTVDVKSADIFDKTRALLADRKMAKGYEGSLREALRSCK